MLDFSKTQREIGALVLAGATFFTGCSKRVNIPDSASVLDRPAATATVEARSTRDLSALPIDRKMGALQDRVLSIRPGTESESSFTIPRDLYEHASRQDIVRDDDSVLSKQRYYRAHIDSTRRLMSALAKEITAGAQSKEEQATMLLEWVRSNISYDYVEQNSSTDYFRTPVETLFEGFGDGEDTALLYVSLCHSVGIETALIRFDRHIAAGVAGDFRGICWNHNGTLFYFAETASVVDGKKYSEVKIGSTPEGYDTLATLYPFYHDRTINVPNMNGENYTVHLPVERYNLQRWIRVDRGTYYRLEDFMEFITEDDPYIQQIAEILTSGGGTKEEKLTHILTWVRDIVEYDQQEADSGREYRRFAFQTVFERCGDCDDSAMLYAALCRAAGYPCALIQPRGHLMIGVEGDFRGTYWEEDGHRYYTAETTGSGRWQIGSNVSYERAVVLPIPVFPSGL